MYFLNHLRLFAITLHIMIVYYFIRHIDPMMNRYICYISGTNKEEITKIVLPLRLVEENGKLTVHHIEAEQILTQNRLYKAFVPCVVFLVMELISFFAGFSLFVKAQQQLSLFCHIVGILFLYGFIYHAYVKSFLLFVVLSPAVLPFISELVIIIKHYFIMF